MPNIEISAEQANALARGESITIAPQPKEGLYVASYLGTTRKPTYVCFGYLDEEGNLHYSRNLYLGGRGGADLKDAPVWRNEPSVFNASSYDIKEF